MQRMEEGYPSPLECSSGCTSGWTMYLGQSFEKPTSLPPKEAVYPCKNGQYLVEEETDLSMISDASSGPQNFYDHDDEGHQHGCYFNGDGCFCSAALLKKGGKRRRAEREEGVGDPSSLLDDTASSHEFSFSKNCFNPNTSKMISSMEEVLDISIGFSTTHLNGKSALQLGTSLPLKPTSKAKPGRKQERNTTMLG